MPDDGLVARVEVGDELVVLVLERVGRPRGARGPGAPRLVLHRRHLQHVADERPLRDASLLARLLALERRLGQHGPEDDDRAVAAERVLAAVAGLDERVLLQAVVGHREPNRVLELGLARVVACIAVAGVPGGGGARTDAAGARDHARQSTHGMILSPAAGMILSPSLSK